MGVKISDIFSGDGMIHAVKVEEPVQKGDFCTYDPYEVAACLSCKREKCAGRRDCVKRRIKEMKRKEDENGNQA